MISLNKQNKGFTIVELLIVIVVIGILAGLVITTYNGIQQKARNTERTTDLKTLQSQLEAYYATNAYYPGADSNGLGGSNTSAVNVAFIKANMKGTASETLRDPKAAAGDYTLGTTAASGKYAYAPTKDDGSACTTAAGDCTKYTLTAVPEGGGSNITLDSLN